MEGLGTSPSLIRVSNPQRGMGAASALTVRGSTGYSWTRASSGGWSRYSRRSLNTTVSRGGLRFSSLASARATSPWSVFGPSLLLLLRGATYDDAEAAAIGLAIERELPFISAYNDAAVVAGGGTIALEVVEDLPSTRTMVVPAGGGGLIGGIGVAAHGLNPQMAIYGVQSTASPALHTALKAGARVPVDVMPSLADGLSGNVEAGSITLDLLTQHVRAVLLVEEADIVAAMRWLLEHEHVLVEGSAAVGVAALMRRLLPTDGPLILVLTGRNVAAEVLRQYLLA